MSSNSQNNYDSGSHDETLTDLLQAYQSAGFTEDEAYDKMMDYEDQVARDWDSKGQGDSGSSLDWSESK